jgi:hypothetical protein
MRADGRDRRRGQPRGGRPAALEFVERSARVVGQGDTPRSRGDDRDWVGAPRRPVEEDLRARCRGARRIGMHARESVREIGPRSADAARAAPGGPGRARVGRCAGGAEALVASLSGWRDWRSRRASITQAAVLPAAAVDSLVSWSDGAHAAGLASARFRREVAPVRRGRRRAARPPAHAGRSGLPAAAGLGLREVASASAGLPASRRGARGSLRRLGSWRAPAPVRASAAWRPLGALAAIDRARRARARGAAAAADAARRKHAVSRAGEFAEKR